MINNELKALLEQINGATAGGYHLDKCTLDHVRLVRGTGMTDVLKTGLITQRTMGILMRAYLAGLEASRPC
jgi:hypothetical protein